MQTIHQQYMEYTRLYKETDLLYAAIAEHSGISPGMFWSLYTVYSTPGDCTAKDICGCCAMSKQTVHSALKNLEWGGYVRLEACESDRRSKKIVLLEKGERYAEAYLHPLFQAEMDAFSALSAEERAGLLRGEQHFLAHLRARMQPLLNSEKEKKKNK